MKKYIVESWYKKVEEFDSLKKAEKAKKFYEAKGGRPEVKLFEIDETRKEL